MPALVDRNCCRVQPRPTIKPALQRTASWLAPLLLGSGLAASATAAQQVRGVVLDVRGRAPVPVVQLDLLQKERVYAAVIADSAGRFVLTAPGSGRYTLRATRIGYATAVIADLLLNSSETVDVELLMAEQPIALQPLRIVTRGRMPSAYLEGVGFYERERTGAGSYLTRYEIDQKGGALLSQLLRSVNGVRLVKAEPEGRRFDVRLRNARCPPTLLVDGAIARLGGPARAPDMALDELINIADVEGIEIYAGPSETPAQFNRNAMCGVIAIWTRRRR